MAFLNNGGDGGGMPRAEINMIPLIDVMLVLLVIFMITAPLLTQAVKLDLPRANAHPVKPAEKVEIAINAKGQAHWDGLALSTEEMTARLKVLGQSAPETEIHLHADKRTRYEQIVVVMAEASRAGLKRIGFVTQPQSEE